MDIEQNLFDYQFDINKRIHTESNRNYNQRNKKIIIENNTLKQINMSNKINNSKFDYHWYFKYGYEYTNNLTVFDCFSCGGGSTMGYKLAGYNHLGGIDLDSRLEEIYKSNHNPKFYYNQDIRDFNNRNDLPSELYDLDILNGSPPCKNFSINGLRKLDDLIFSFCETINKLKPKIAIIENVKGLITTSAKQYILELVNVLNSIGYDSQIFLLNSATMGVPQKRERVFIIASKQELKFQQLNLGFYCKPIHYGNVKGSLGKEISKNDKSIWNNRTYGDRGFNNTIKRINGKYQRFNTRYIYKELVCPTILSDNGSIYVEFDNPNVLSKEKLCQIGTFPIDYDFKKMNPKYLIGMSVPPVMMAQIAYQIYKQWFK